MYTFRIEKSEKLHSNYSNECVEANVKHEYYTITAKSPGEGICQSSIDNNADMIVIGNRGLGKIKRTLLGSVSDFVVNRSSIPVTIVPPTDD